MYCLFCVVLCTVCVCICILYYCHRVATQLQLTNISYHIHFTSHPALIPFPSPHLTDIHPTSNFIHFTSRHFTSLHLSLSNPCSWKYPIFSVLQNPFTLLHLSHFSPFCWIYCFFVTSNSLHVTSLTTFLTLCLMVLGLEGNVLKAFIVVCSRSGWFYLQRRLKV